MNIPRLLASILVSVFVFAYSSTGASAAVVSPASGAVPACPGPAHAGAARCHAQVVFAAGKAAATGPAGLAPVDIFGAYGWSGAGTGAGKTIGIVDAYDDPKVGADLSTFSSTFHLPVLPACNAPLPRATNQPCFAKVDQNGGTKYPRANQGWALEISLDTQWAHAVAPAANILLVEASSSSFANLMTAEDYASSHAQYVSNSWGGGESSAETSYDVHFATSGVSYFASAGDSGLPAEYPSASPNVVSVGGTTLTGSGTTWSETGWSNGGGGCSAYETANAAQSSFSQYAQSACGGARATPDVSLDANPYSGVSVLDTYGYQGQKGWFVVGGTSASSPMWAARSADAGVLVNASYVYGTSIGYRDILAGSSGTTQSGCNSAGCVAGYDLSTGRGTWTGSTP